MFQTLPVTLPVILSCASLISLPVFNILVHVGVVLTYPILISIGTLLSVPGNAGLVSYCKLQYATQLTDDRLKFQQSTAKKRLDEFMM